MINKTLTAILKLIGIVIAAPFALLALALVFAALSGCTTHQREFTEHYDRCMQDLNMRTRSVQIHPGGYEARNACRVYAQREARQ